MSIAVPRSNLQQLSRSALQQRGGSLGPQAFVQSIFLEDINATVDTSVPGIPDQGHYGLELAGIPYSILQPNNNLFNAQNYFRFYHNDLFSNEVWNSSGADFGVRAGTQLTIIQLFYGVDVFQNFGTFSNSPVVVPAIFWGTGAQLQLGDHGALSGPGQYHHFWEKSRTKFNRPVGNFAFRSDIWVRKRNDHSQYGWMTGDYPVSADPMWLVGGPPFGSWPLMFRNPSLYRAYSVTAANTYIEVPYDFPNAPLPGTLQDGFIGQGIFVVCFETPAAFTARTGISISGT